VGLLTNLSIFSGVGGLDLAARWTGKIKTVCYVEKDKYAQAVIQSRIRSQDLDDAPIWDDVALFDGRPWNGLVDIVSGGFTCQQHSSVGKRLGQLDAGNTWPLFKNVVQQVQPISILAENVLGIADSGYALTVLADLEEMGYCATPYTICACEVGAPHPRARVFFLAHAKSITGLQTNTAPHKNGEMPGAWSGDIRRMWEEMAKPDWQIPPRWILGDIDGLARRMDRARCCGNAVNPIQVLPAWEEILRINEQVRPA